MVRATRNLLMRLALYGVMLMLGAWMLTPTVISNRIDSRTRPLRSAIVAYRTAHGRFAGSLVDVVPYVEQQTRVPCTIRPKTDNWYTVEMGLATGMTVVMDVEYSVSLTGEWEEFDVQVTDSRNSD